MGRPAGISKTVENILRVEAERLNKKAEESGLDDLELARVQKLLAISQLLTAPRAAGDGEATQEELDAAVKELAPKPKDPGLFPKRGPKSTSGIYKPEE